MSFSLRGKAAIVTGGNGGIGKAVVESFHANGCKVAVASRGGPILSKSGSAVEKADIVQVKADVTVERDVKHLVKEALSRFGAIDILVNNVGPTGPVKRIENLTLGEWNETVAGCLTSAFLCSREVAPIMKERGSGSIINISSMIVRRPAAFRSPYVAAKMGLIGLTKSLSAELAPYGVKVNVIIPASVEGERMNYLMKEYARLRKTTFERTREGMINATQGRRFLTPREVANVALFLASRASKGTTGQEIDLGS